MRPATDLDHVGRVMEQWRAERPDLDVAPQAVIARLHRVAAALTEELVAVYGRYGLGEGEFDVLATLRRSGQPFELNPTDLAEQTMVSSGAVTKRVDRCIANGWATRRTSGHDGRGRIIALTPQGRALIDEAFEAHIENERRLVSALPEQDRRLLSQALQAWALELGV